MTHLAVTFSWTRSRDFWRARARFLAISLFGQIQHYFSFLLQREISAEGTIWSSLIYTSNPKIQTTMSKEVINGIVHYAPFWLRKAAFKINVVFDTILSFVLEHPTIRLESTAR